MGVDMVWAVCGVQSVAPIQGSASLDEAAGQTRGHGGQGPPRRRKPWVWKPSVG